MLYDGEGRLPLHAIRVMKEIHRECVITCGMARQAEKSRYTLQRGAEMQNERMPDVARILSFVAGARMRFSAFKNFIFMPTVPRKRVCVCVYINARLCNSGISAKRSNGNRSSFRLV